MQLGIFAKIFDRPNVSSCLQAVADAGIPATQFNLSVAGLPTIPDEPVPDDVVDAIRASANQAGVALAAISGTFNAAHPDPAHQQIYLARFPHLCVVARDLQIGIVVVTRPRRLRWRARTYPHPQHRRRYNRTRTDQLRDRHRGPCPRPHRRRHTHQPGQLP